MARTDLPARRAIHGVLLLDKARGASSNAALQAVKRLFRAEKAGHTGTLDPLATGLLPICFGAATKFSQTSLEADKTYLATLALGVTTTTADGEGEVVGVRPVSLSREQITRACERFTGAIEQTPPMHSALKHEGKALYRYARRGIEVERATRRLVIHRIDVVEWQGDRLVLDVHCSKGTYLRTLAADIGEALGCGAHLAALRRTRSGSLDVQGAHCLESMQAMSEPERDSRLLPVDTLLVDWPEVRLDAEEAGRFLAGMRRRLDMHDVPRVRVYGPQPSAFLGSAHVAGGELISTRLLSPLEVRSLPVDR